MKKQIIITLLFLILLASVVYCTAPAVTHHGLQIFSDGVTVKNGNLTVTDANSVAKFTVDPNNIEFRKDEDAIFSCGRGKVGYLSTTYPDNFAIAHYDNFSNTKFALRQDNNGYTILNGVNYLYFQLNGSTYATMTTSGLTMSEGKPILFSGNLVTSLSMNRHTTADTAGNALTVQAGGATVSATDKAGGTLALKAGIGTGTGPSQIDFYTATAGTTGTTDNTPSLKLSLNSNGDLIPGIDNNSYIGKNDDDAPFAYKGLILKDTTNGKYYRIEVISGVLTATDLTD